MYSVKDITTQREYHFMYFEDAEKFFREYRVDNNLHQLEILMNDRVLVKYNPDD